MWGLKRPGSGELQAALATASDWGGVKTGRIIGVHRTTAWAWVKLAQAAAESAGEIPKGRKIDAPKKGFLLTDVNLISQKMARQ